MLEGKIALVTGAAKGIGRAIALALAADGATVVVNYNGSKERAEQVVEEIKALGRGRHGISVQRGGYGSHGGYGERSD